MGVTAEDFDKTRGKINVQQTLMERIEGVRATGLADEIIIEEYEGQKIDDIRRYHVDIFAIGSDWRGKFDYLNEYCKVVYLDRTEGCLLYTSMQLHAGPVYRPELFSMGLQRIVLGLFKKIVIANRLAGYVDAIYGAPESLSLIHIWTAGRRQPMRMSGRRYP